MASEAVSGATSGDSDKTDSPGTPPLTKQKIDVLLKATGDAPIMKKKKWAVEPEKKVSWIIEFIRRYLKLDTNETLFLYVNQAFAPSPDQIISNLFECFETDGKLVLHYCRTPAWG